MLQFSMDKDEFGFFLLRHKHYLLLDIEALEALADAVPQSVTASGQSTSSTGNALPLPDRGEITCAIPLAMICISAIDFYGNLTKDVGTGFVQHLRAFFGELLEIWDFDESWGGDFEIGYRHSIMHAYMPSGRLKFAIGYYKDNTSLYHWDVQGSAKVLNVAQLSSYTKAGIEIFFKKVEADDFLEQAMVIFEKTHGKF